MPTLVSNKEAVLRAVAAAPGGLARSDLEERADLSRPTVGAVIEELTREGWLEEFTNGRPGKPPRLVRLGGRAGLVAGADLGHRHAHVAIADANGRILAQANRENIDIDTYGPAALGLVAELLAECLAAADVKVADIRGLALGVPGPVTLGGMLASSLFLGNWTTVELEEETKDELRRKLGRQAQDIPVLVENDANLGAHAEARVRGPGCKNLWYLKVSTGIGMGLLLDGAVYRGQTGVAGEFGHVSVPAAAQRLTGLEASSLTLPCTRCKKPDCLENLASCDAIVSRLRRSDDRYPPDLTVEAVIDNALHHKAQHPKCLEAVLDAGRWIGYALAEQVTVLDPEVIVVGGILSAAGEVLVEPIRDAIEAHSVGLSDVEVVALVPDRIRSVELEGAVALALTHTQMPAYTTSVTD